MTLPQFDFAGLIERLKDLDYLEMLEYADRSAAAAEGHTSRVSAKKIDQHGSADFRYKVGPLLFFLRSGVKPGGITEADWLLSRSLVERLVAKGQMKQEALDQF